MFIRRDVPNQSFPFIDPGLLIDDDLLLISPEPRWIDEVVRACDHPLTRRESPHFGQNARQTLVDFLAACPLGRQKPDPANGVVPCYHFWMLSRSTDLAIAGGIALRIGHTVDVECYYGHVGYHVYPSCRGHHYAERACRLLLPLARRHGLRPLWITCNPDNAASRRTCERLGARLIEIVQVPSDHALYLRGEREKCRYRLDM
jgi:tagatose 1,6-diphosphate aldolase